MTDKVISPASFSKLRFEAFWKKCKEHCKSKKSFFKKFEIDQRHITEAGLLKNHRRLSLNANDYAAIVEQGELIYERCRDSTPIEIAVEGKILDFEWIDFNTMSQNKDPFVEVRVIIRESSPKFFIVTVYVLDALTDNGRPEVKRNEW